MKKSRIGLVVVAASFCTIWALVAQQTPPAGSPPQGAPGGRGPAAAGPGGRGPGGGGPARQRARKVVLAWADTRNGISQHDSVSHALAVIERLGYESNVYDTFIRTDSNIAAKQAKKTDGTPASGGPSLSMADAIFYMGHREVPIDDSQKQDLISFLRDDGKGLVASHVALTSFESWPEWVNILGARYEGHPWNRTGTVIVEDQKFPATKFLPATFDVVDEFYMPKDYDRANMHVLMRLDVSKMPPNANYTRKDGDFPLAWAKQYGKGRVFWGSFAHDAKLYDNPDIYRMFYEALRWSMGLTELGDLSPTPFKGGGLPGTAPAEAAQPERGGPPAGGRGAAPAGAPAGAPGR